MQAEEEVFSQNKAALEEVTQARSIVGLSLSSGIVFIVGRKQKKIGGLVPSLFLWERTGSERRYIESLLPSSHMN